MPIIIFSFAVPIFGTAFIIQNYLYIFIRIWMERKREIKVNENSLIERANKILDVYEKKENKRDIYVQQMLPLEHSENEIEKVIKNINPLEITPMDALKLLYDLKQKVKE